MHRIFAVGFATRRATYTAANGAFDPGGIPDATGSFITLSSEAVMESVLVVCLLVGSGLAAVSTVVLLAVGLERGRSETEPPDGEERREFTRVPCQFRALGDPPGTALWPGDLSLGGACVRLPAATVGPRLTVVAVDRHGVAPAATIEGRVVSMQREGNLFAHHLMFEPGRSNVSVAALVAASAWAE